MKKIIDNINEIGKDDVFAIAYAVSDGTWVSGFFNHIAFEAKVDDVVVYEGVNDGRVTRLDVVAKHYTEDNSYSTTIARFGDNEWQIRPGNAYRQTINDLVSHLETLPHHSAFEE